MRLNAAGRRNAPDAQANAIAPAPLADPNPGAIPPDAPPPLPLLLNIPPYINQPQIGNRKSGNRKSGSKSCCCCWNPEIGNPGAPPAGAGNPEIRNRKSD